MSRLSKTLFALVVSTSISVSVSADKEAWSNFAPPEDKKFDWIQLNSGEWLKGKIKVMYNYTLEFDSDELDLLELDMDDVKQIRSSGVQRIMVEKRRRDVEILRGKLVVDGETVKLINGEDVQEINRHRLVSIAGGAQRERDQWSGSFSVGLTARGGNTETTDVTSMANIKRRTAMTRMSIDYIANYSKAKDTQTAKNQRLNGYFDWFLTGRLYWKILGAEYYHDPFVNIESQYSIFSSLGYDLARTSKTEWTANAGGGYQETKFDSVQVGNDDQSNSGFATIGTRLDHEISGDLDFLYDYSARFLNASSGEYTHHMVATLSYELIADLDLDVSFIWDRIGNPTPIESTDDSGVVTVSVPEQDDYQIVVGVAYDF
ncbi:hypothetical protein PDESU_02774 [Pontiella desulfatans]|uniref:DUF481 domain-containing protein n=1 Tax=Pontiella desulfatans TaxID=2750659 RepID=A0A6C2U2Y7_PONDE|nr:DUF481 domain-containing protein [Pontiella desulfatans]VGO14215.1 hypothetical protein PDESU_02774 [Pontiella desulfatans]